LCGGGENVTLIPAGLVESEKKFVASLRDYCESHREQIKELEIFLLRNLPHRGVGFPDESGDNFYPDFILWVKRGKDQRVVFVEPHGLLQDPVPAENSKVKLHKWLEEISKRWGGRYAQQMEIDSFIVSDTHPDELRRRWGTENDPDNHQILFLDEDQDLVPVLLKWKSRGKPRR